MRDFGFIFPQALWALAGLVPVLVVWTFARRRRERKLAEFVAKENWGLLSPYVSSRARFHKGLLFLLALVFSVLAAARPYSGVREREVRRRGLNVLFAVDVSMSMKAGDVTPDRIGYAKKLMRQVIAEFRGQRIGIMPFAGEAFLQCPLTTDYGILLDVVRSVDVTSVAYQGTDIPAMIDQAIAAFERSGDGNRVLVVFTDGEDHSQAIMDAAARAADAGVKIYALGIGTLDGAPILHADGSYVEDASGIKVVSRLNPAILRDLAEKTGGRAYAGGKAGALDIDPLIEDLRAIEKGDLGEEKREVREEVFQWFLGVALLCLLLEALIGERRRIPIPPKPAAAAA